MGQVEEISILPGYKTDHSDFIRCKIRKICQRKGFLEIKFEPLGLT